MVGLEDVAVDCERAAAGLGDLECDEVHGLAWLAAVDEEWCGRVEGEGGIISAGWFVGGMVCRRDGLSGEWRKRVGNGVGDKGKK